MSTKRTDKILDLLDGALQSTTPRHHGAGYGPIEQDMCVGCLGKPPVEGRSWCERCLPENQPDYVAPDDPTAETPMDHLPGFSLSIPLTDEDPFHTSGMFAIYVGDPAGLPLAGLFVDDNNEPVGLGVDVGMLLAAPAETVTGLGAILIELLGSDQLPALVEVMMAADRLEDE